MNEKSVPCAYWREGEICSKCTEPGYTDFCVLGPCSQMKPSNGDRIRQMSDEELAELLEGKYGNMLPNTALNWLKKEAVE